MKGLLIVSLLLIGLIARAGDDKPLTLEYLGHACFVLDSAAGVRILMDPYQEGMGYSMKKVQVDAVTVSHEHGDHNNQDLAEGSPKVIRGLDEKGGWAKVDETVGDVRIRSVGAFHFAGAADAKRGKNAIMIFETGGMNLVHLGDLGRALDDEQVKAIGRVDVLLVPVGGFFTIDAKEADQVIDQLKPKLVIPMHYQSGPGPLPISGVDKFLAGKDRVRKPGSSAFAVTDLPDQTTIVVLEPRP